MSDLETLLADGNSSAARRARVKLQPRDKKGRWVPTGAALLAAIRGLNGVAKKYKLKAIGGTTTSKGEKNKIRALLTEDAPELGLKKNTVLEVDPKNGELDTGIKLSRDYLKSKGINPDLQHTLPKSIAEQPESVNDMNPQEADDLDIELANGGLNSDEDKDFRKERDQEPLAKLPPGLAEQAVEGEDVKDIVDGESKAQGPLSRETSDEVKKTAPLDLSRGDVIRSNEGNDATIVDLKFSGDLESVKVTLQDENGNVTQKTFESNKPVNVVKTPRRSPARPARQQSEPAPETTPEPTPDVTPEEAPEPDVIPEDQVAPEAEVENSLVPADFPPADKIDDGGNIDLQELDPDVRNQMRRQKLDPIMTADGQVVEFVDQDGNIVKAQDPFAIMTALANAYPDAKFSEDGMALVLHRQKDKDGRVFELRANNTGKKSVLFEARWTDTESGKSERFVYKNDAHGISAALGSYGPEYLLDRILGRSEKNQIITGFGNSRNATMEDTLYFRFQTAFRGPSDVTNDRVKFVNLVENATRLAAGRSVEYHPNSHRVKNSAIPSLWDSFDEFMANPDEANKEDFFNNMYTIFGMQPLDEASHTTVMRAIRDAYEIKFPNSPDNVTRAFHAHVTNASRRMRGIYRGPDPEVRAVRYASKNRTTPIEQGMTVEYTNRVGDKSILKVKSLVKNTNAGSIDDSDMYNYGDYVVIEDANGNKRLLNSLKLRVLPNQEAPLTAYKANPVGEALRARREEAGEILPLNQSADRILPEAPILTSLADSQPKLVEDFTAGDVLRDRSGNPIGEILSTKSIQSASGKDGISFLVRKADGETVKVNYAVGTELPPKKA